MLTTMKKKSQVTIPKNLVDELGLKPGDSLDARVSNGVITLIPMALYPKASIEKIKADVTAIDSGERANKEVLQNIKNLFGSMAGTSMSSDAFATSKQADLELE